MQVQTGEPHPADGGGYSIPGLDGGYPIPGLDGGGYIILLMRGVRRPRSGWGVSHPRSRWRVPHPADGGSSPIQDQHPIQGTLPIQDWMVYPHPSKTGWGTPLVQKERKRICSFNSFQKRIMWLAPLNWEILDPPLLSVKRNEISLIL